MHNLWSVNYKICWGLPTELTGVDFVQGTSFTVDKEGVVCALLLQQDFYGLHIHNL